MTIEDRLKWGQLADDVLRNEAFIRAFDHIEQELTESWKSSPARDQEGREKIYLSLKIAAKYKAVLTEMLESGKLATADRIYQESVLDKIREMSPFSERY